MTDKQLATELLTIREMLRWESLDERFLSPADVRERTTLSDTEIARRQAEGHFPPWVSLGPSKRAIPRSWVMRWIGAMIAGEPWTAEDSANCQREWDRRRSSAA